MGHVTKFRHLIGFLVAMSCGEKVTTVPQGTEIIEPGSDFLVSCRFKELDVTSSVTWSLDRERLHGDGNYGTFAELDLLQIELISTENSGDDVTQVLDFNENSRFKSYSTGYYRDPKTHDIISYVIIRNATARDGGQYVCSALSRNGKRKSGNIVIIVKDEILSIRKTPDQNITSGGALALPCSILGSEDYQAVTWYFAPSNDVDELKWSPIVPNSKVKINKHHEIIVKDIDVKDSGSYKCEVEDFAGRIISKTSPVFVQELPQIEALVVQPHKPEVNDYVMMTCTLEKSETKTSINWMKNGIRIDGNLSSIRKMGNRISLLQIERAKLDDGGNYSCVASNNAGTTMETALLLVHERPFVVESPSDVTVTESHEAFLYCVIKGSPLPVVTWSRIMADHSILNFKSGILVTHSNMTSNSSLRLNNVTKIDAGVYICAGKNDAGDVTSRTTLKVNAPARITGIVPNSQVHSDHDVTFYCTASGDGELNITWFYEENNLNLNKDNLSLKQNVVQIVGRRGMELTSYLTISEANKLNEGRYTCKVYSVYGEDEKSTHLTVFEKPLPPKTVEFVERGVNYIQLLIHSPLSDGGIPVTSYFVRYKRITFMNTEQYVSTKEITVTPSENRNESVGVMVDDLQCGSDYAFNVTSYNLVGESMNSFNLLGRTIGEAPLLTSMKDFIVEINQTSVVVDLNAWFDGGCEIQDISLEFSNNNAKTNNQSQFFGLDILDYRKTKTISNLQPGEWYRIRSIACNIVGCEEIIHSIPTLQQDGSEINSPFILKDAVKSENVSLGWRYILPMVLGFLLILVLGFLLVFYHCKQSIKKRRRIKEAERVASFLLERSEYERKSRDHTSTVPSMKSRDTASHDASYLAYSINEFDDDVFLSVNENRQIVEGETKYSVPDSTTLSDCDEEVKNAFESVSKASGSQSKPPALPPRNRPPELSYTRKSIPARTDVNVTQTSTPQPGTSHQPWDFTPNGTPYDVIKILRTDRNGGGSSSSTERAKQKTVRPQLLLRSGLDSQKGAQSLSQYPLYHSKSKLRRSVFDSMPRIRNHLEHRTRAHSDDALLNADKSTSAIQTKMSTRNDSGCFTVMEPENWESIRKHFADNQSNNQSKKVPTILPRHASKEAASSTTTSSNHALSLDLTSDNTSVATTSNLKPLIVTDPPANSSSVFLTPPDSSPEENIFLKPPEIFPRKKLLGDRNNRMQIPVNHGSVSSDLSNASGVSYTLV